MKKILLVMLSFLLFGFTPEYYTEENTDAIFKNRIKIVLDKSEKEVTGLFIGRNKESGNISATPLVNGVSHGLGKFFSDDMNYYLETEFKDGLQNGLQTFYELFDNQTFNIDEYVASSSNIIEAIQNMENFFLKHSIKTRTIEYKNDLKDGIERSYYTTPEGSWNTFATYSRGRLSGLEKRCYYVQDNSACLEANYVNGYREGKFKFFLNDIILYDEQYKKGVEHGLMNIYEDGYIVETILYINGEKSGKSFLYDKHGNKIIEAKHVKGKVSYLKTLNNSNNSANIEVFFSEDNFTKGYCYNQVGKKRILSKHDYNTFTMGRILVINSKRTKFQQIQILSKLGASICE